MHWNDLLGKRIGPYEILEELGRGGTARVYRAFQESLGRQVALKVMANESEDRAGFVRRFEREVAAVAQLDHPNIVAVYDSGEYEDLVYLVMQCINGGTLRQRLGEPLGVPDACIAMIQMARALHHAHLHGIVHRDVKPSNMLIDPTNQDKLLLTDFGIARLQGLRGLTKSGTTVGTPEYMAPEQAEGRDIDARVDVYSLGCVLYEALAGRPPFTGSAPVSVLYQQVHSRPSYIRGFNPHVPRELAHVIDVALAKRPEERFPTAEALAHALYPFTEGRDRAVFATRVSAAATGPAATSAARARASASALDLRTQATSDETLANGADGAAGGTRPGAGLGGRSTPIPPLARPPSGEFVFPPPSSDLGDRGLGAEGLDAIFPDDPEAAASERARLAARESGDLAREYVTGRLNGTTFPPDGSSRTDSAPWGAAALSDQFATNPDFAGLPPAAPFADYGAPAADPAGGALSIPLTSTGQLDFDALMTAVEGEISDTWPEEWTNPSVAAFGTVGGPPIGAAPDAAPGAPPHAVPGSPDARFDKGAIWRPEELELPLDEPGPRRTRRARKTRRAPILVVLGCFVLLIGLYAAISISGIGIAGRIGHETTPTATTAPTTTATALPPTATTGPTPQQVLDQQARVAFRAITLEPRYDPTCAARPNTTTYTHTQKIYLDLCVSTSAPAAGQLSVELLRGDGSVVYQMATNQAIAPGTEHHFDVYNLVPGKYYFLVTFDAGVAADLAFAVTH